MLFEHAAGPVGADGAAGVLLRAPGDHGGRLHYRRAGQRANAAFSGRPSTAGREGAFPQARWVATAESGTGSLAGAAFGPYTTGERTLTLGRLPCFGRACWCWPTTTSCPSPWPATCWPSARTSCGASASFTLKPVKVLADGTYLAELKPLGKG
jgi:hypothetical protein